MSIKRVIGVAALCLLMLSGFSGAFARDSAQGSGSSADSAITSDAAAERQFQSMDREVQALKEEVLDLNRDLFLLEEELLFPANSQVAFFISMDVGEYFALDSVNLKIDGKDVTNYLYTEREVDALLRGGVHRLHMANLKTGDHELVAVFNGEGPNSRDYRRGATLTFDKGIGAKYIELQITDRVTKQQPEFVIKEWE